MIKPTNKLSHLKKEFAQTMVEFALVFPIVLLISYGIMEFGRMVFIYAAVTGAAREGARYGAAAGDLTARHYMNCDGIRNATRRGAILIPITDNDITVWYDRGPGTPSFPNSNICPPGVSYYPQDVIDLGNRIQVHVEVQYEPIIPFLGFDGFPIISENARTILMNVEIEE